MAEAKEDPVQAEIARYTWHTPLSREARQFLIDQIEESQAMEPEINRRDFSPKDISDADLYLLWLRS